AAAWLREDTCEEARSDRSCPLRARPLGRRHCDGRRMTVALPAYQWSGFDIRDLASRGFAKRMSNPKLHWNPIFPGGPLILTFAKVPAERSASVRIGPLEAARAISNL